MRKNTRGFVMALVIVIVGFAALFYLLISQGIKKKILRPISEEGEKAVSLLSPTPTSFPFQEMTVPYLRQRAYVSELSNLERASENQGYTSFVTSYNSDGLKIYGLLTIPKGSFPGGLASPKSDEGGWPAIVFVHGYIPPENYQTKVNYASYVDYLAKNGFVVLKIDLRGHGDSEGEPAGAYYSGDYVIDTLNAYAALRSVDFVNSEKIGLWGHSMAGNIVLRSMAAEPEMPAAVIWAGAGYTYTDLAEYMIEDTSYRPPPADSERARKRQELRATYGNFDPNHRFWKQVPATNYLADVKGAIQIHHAVNDNVVSINYSRNLTTLLNQTAIIHELKEYPAGGHNLSGSTFSQAMENTVIFFKKHL